MLVSDEYRKQLQEMHQPMEDGRTWGATAAKRVYDIARWIKADGPHATLLDYGSADGKFQKQLRRRLPEFDDMEIVEYDPGIPGKEFNNIPCPFVICVDVLEHIEPALLENVLDDLQRCTEGYGLFYIAMFPAKKTLPDGRNAHLIIESSDWWLAKIQARWELLASEVFRNGDLATLMVYVKRIER